jgi:hypothetical protein
MEVANQIYLVWSNEHQGWWRHGSSGYTRGLRNAGRYTRDAALQICREAIPTAAHIGLISEIPVRLSDVEEFLAGQIMPGVIIMDGND